MPRPKTVRITVGGAKPINAGIANALSVGVPAFLFRGFRIPPEGEIRLRRFLAILADRGTTMEGCADAVLSQVRLKDPALIAYLI